MATVAELLVKIGADSSDLRKEIAATKRQLRTAFGEDALSFSKAATVAIGGLTAAMGALGVAAVQAGGELQNVQVAMTNMLGSAEKSTGFIKELQYFAAHTPFEFNDVTKASQKFLAFGFTAEQIIPTLTAVGDAAAGVGAGQDGVNRLTVALGQIAAKGKLASQEMMQVTELGIPAWKLLADKLGTDVANAQDMVTKRMVDSKMALEALVEGMEKNYGGMMAQQSTTILGTWSNLMDGVGQVASQAGLKIATAFDLPSVFSGLGDWLSDFASAIEQSGIGAALVSCVPPGLQIAIVAFGTALTTVAIPAMIGAGMAAKAMIAPFVIAIGSAVSAAAPFIAAITLIVTALYAFYASGLSVSDVLNFMGVKSDRLNAAWEAMKSTFSSIGRVIIATINNMTPLWVMLGAVVGSVITLISKFIGAFINVLLSVVTIVSNVVEAICSAFEWLVKTIGKAIDAISSTLRNMADSILPSWASSSLSTISNFVNSATSYLNGLLSKIFDTNTELANAGGGSTDKKEDTPQQKKWERPDFINFKGASDTKEDSGEPKGGKSSKDTIVTKAASTSKSIEEEWVRTFSTKSELVERWYKEEMAELDKSKTANDNYERDKQRLSELYAQKRITALQEEAKKTDEIKSRIRDMAHTSAEASFTLNGDLAERELLKMSLAHEKAVSEIEDRWTDLSNTYIGLNEAEREVFLESLTARNIAFEQTESGELDFHKQMLEEKLAADKEYEDQKAEYHNQCRDIQAELDEAYRLNDIARLQEILTEENAIRLNDLEAQKTMMDTYSEAILMQHTTVSQLIASLYSSALHGLEQAFTSILSGSKSAKQAFADLGKSMIKVIAQYFAKQLAGMLVGHAMGESIKKKESATSAAEASAQLAAWTPVAVAYETVHPGSAARALATVSASLAAAASIASAMQALNQGTGAASSSGGSSGGIDIPGFAKGGYFTGPTLGIIGEGPDNEVALPLNKAVFNNIAEGIVNAGDANNTTVTQNIYGDINEAADVDDLFSGLNNMVAAGLRGA